MKRNKYKGLWVNSYFWRTKDQKEIDYIEEADQRISAFEFKWNANQKVKNPTVFTETYKGDFNVVTNENYEAFLL